MKHVWLVATTPVASFAEWPRRGTTGTVRYRSITNGHGYVEKELSFDMED